MGDTFLQDAVLRNIGVLGEAASKLLAECPEYAAQHPEIPLAKIYATRNRITHAYEDVDLRIIWNLVEFEVPALRPKIAAALKGFEAKG